MSENTIHVIKPYKWEGLWVFDDDRVGLVKEPFVAGTDTLIDLALAMKGIPAAEQGFLLLFSAHPFPGQDFELEWVREELEGNVYRSADLHAEGWLCPALLKYFDQAPPKLHLQLMPSR